MYGEPGGLQGETTIAQLLSDAGYVTQAVGKWHLGENVESQAQNVGFDDFYGFLSVSDMYSEWRDGHFFPDIVYSEARTEWIKNMPFNKCFVHAKKGGESQNVEEVTIPVLSELDEKWCQYSTDFIGRMAKGDKPWLLYHCTRGAHFDNYPNERFLGKSPARHPYKDTLLELDEVMGRLIETPAGDRPARRYADLRHVRQRSAHGDVAGLGLHAVSLRQGLDLGGRRARSRPADVAGHDRCGTSERRDLRLQRHPADVTGAQRRDHRVCLPTATSTASIRPRFCLRPTASRTASITTTGSRSTFSGVRCGEYKYMVAATSDEDAGSAGPGGFTGVLQKFAYAKLFNLYLDPKENHNYMTRKLAYMEAFQLGVRSHLGTYKRFPPKRVMGIKAPDPRQT